MYAQSSHNAITLNISRFLESSEPKELINFLSTEEEQGIYDIRIVDNDITSNNYNNINILTKCI